MPRKHVVKARFCEFCGNKFGKERGPAAKTCSLQCERQRNSRKEKARYERVKGSEAWKQTRAEYLDRLKKRAACDPEFAAQLAARHRAAVRAFRKAVEADPQRLAQYRAQRRQWHHARTPQQRAERALWYRNLSPAIKALFLLDLKKKRAFGRLVLNRELIEKNMTYKWNDEHTPLLGTIADEKLAQIAGCTPAAVAYRRKKLGIGPFVPESRRWKEEYTPLLGTKSDTDIASELGIPVGVVRYQREKKGIEKSPDARPIWTQEEKDLLGTMPDIEVAKKIGRTPAAVRQQRVELGIPACSKKTGSTRKAAPDANLVLVTPAVLQKLQALEPLLIKRYEQAGLPVAQLEAWQIIDIALSEALMNAQKSEARKKTPGRPSDV